MATGDEVWQAVQKIGPEDRKSFEILATLAFLAGPGDVVLITERGLARMTGYSRSTVWNRLHSLEDLGWLRRERAGRKTTCRLLIPEGAAL
jgi:DNA-binding Lrp family transcriptional regulator